MLSKYDKRLVRKILSMATVVHVAEPEDVSPEGQFGYDSEDENRAAEQAVYELAERTEWGWCCVKTTITLGDWSTSVYLGCCSYESHDDFVRCDDGTQAHEAACALLDKLRAVKARGAAASKFLRSLGGK